MKKIMLVEDDAPIRDIFELVFKDFGYKLIILENGDKILRGEIEIPDLFILDKQLSGIDGLDICRFIKKHEIMRQIPVIMLSANPTIRLFAKDAGADDAIQKPFSLKQLRDAVASYLGT